jgi:hypothetical protein
MSHIIHQKQSKAISGLTLPRVMKPGFEIATLFHYDPFWGVIPRAAMNSVQMIMLILLWLFCNTSPSQAQRYTEIAAEVEIVYYAAKGTNEFVVDKDLTYPVKCVVGSNEWRIEEGFSINAETIYYFDGTNLYHSDQTTKDVPLMGPSTFSMNEIKDLREFISQLTGQSNALSAFIWKTFSEPEQLLLKNYGPEASTSRQALLVVMGGLNKIVTGPSIYAGERFKGISLRPETVNLTKEAFTITNGGSRAANLVRLNRLLLEDAYPLQLSRKTSMTMAGGRALKPLPFSQIKSNIMIHIEPSPDGAMLGNMGANIPWLAFCSGTYLKRSGRIIPFPVTVNGMDDPQAFAYSDKTTCFDDTFGLPKLVEFFTSQKLAAASLQNERLTRNQRVEQVRLENNRTRISDGILRFRYEVTQETNFLGIAYPKEFSLVFYTISPQGDAKRSGMGTGRLISIREGVKPANLFRPDLRQVIVDDRFRSQDKQVDGIIYRTNISNVPVTNDATLLRIFAQTEKQARIDPVRLAPRIRWGIRILFSLALLCPIVIVLKMGLYKRASKIR